MYTLESAWAQDGCSSSGDSPTAADRPNSFKTCVRCCSDDGTTCFTPHDCTIASNWVTYDDAVPKCAVIGKRLCTREELNTDVCCGTGGSGDSYLVWTTPSGK